ncbi:MAG: hypothetical protein ACUVQZ_07925 [Candidatus Caldatribacteriaceae bacterium]
MKKILWILVIIWMTIASVQAQDFKWLDIPFTELGWEKDQKLEGSNPSYALYLSEFPGIEWEKGYLYLNIEVPEALSPTSSLSVYGDGNLLFTTPLQSGTFPISLQKLSKTENLHRIEIQPYLFISSNLCEDLASENLFCVIKKESRFSLAFQEKTFVTLADFLRFPDNRLEIILPPGKWSRELQEAYCKLYAFLRRYQRDVPTRIETRIAEEEKALLVDHRRIFLHERAERDFRLQGKTLLLTPQGVEAILQNENLLVFPSTKVSIPEKRIFPLVRRISLNPFSFRGIGTLTQTFYFTSSDLGGIPRILRLLLYRLHSPLRENFQGEASFTINLNGELIYTEQLGPNSASIRSPRIISLPPNLLRRENALEFRFSYFPEIGNCHRGVAPFEASISGDSYLEAQGEGDLPSLLTWNEVPTLFWGEGFLVLPEEPTLGELEIGAKINAALRALDHTSISLTILNPKEAQIMLARPPRNREPQLWSRLTLLQEELSRYATFLEIRNAPLLQKLAAFFHFAIQQHGKAFLETLIYSFWNLPISNPPEYFIIVDPSLRLSSSPLAREGKELVLKNTLNGKTLLRIGPDESLGILTVFWENDHPTISFATCGDSNLAIQNFLNAFQDHKTLRRLTGNVVLFSPSGFYSTSTGSQENFQNVTPFIWGEWFSRFRLIIFLILAGLIIILAGLSYNRLVRKTL